MYRLGPGRTSVGPAARTGSNSDAVLPMPDPEKTMGLRGVGKESSLPTPALGSSRGAIAGLVLRQGGVWMVVGLAGGALGVVVLARLLGGLLYGVAPFDPITLAAAAALVACGTLALLPPVRRATRVDPIVVLRAD